MQRNFDISLAAVNGKRNSARVGPARTRATRLRLHGAVDPGGLNVRRAAVIKDGASYRRRHPDADRVRLRSIFAQQSIKAQEIEEDLAITDEAVGRPETVYRFVGSALRELFGVEAGKNPDELELVVPRSEFPEKAASWLVQAAAKTGARLAFRAPVNEGYTYWGRNHGAVETLFRTMLSESLAPFRGPRS